MAPLPELPALQACAPVVHTWWQEHVPIGIFIGILAFVGVVVPWSRGDLRNRRFEQAFWSIVMFLCLAGELISIRQDQAAHRKEDEFARCEQLHNFRDIGERIQRSIDNNATGFNATLNQLNNTLLAATAAMNQTRPYSSLQFTYLSSRYISADGRSAPTPIEEEKPTELNAYYRNGGNDTAELYKRMGLTYVAKSDDKDAEAGAFKEFELKWTDRQSAPNSTPLGPGSTGYFTFSTNPISHSQMLEIQDQKLTVYFIIRLAYRDKTGDWYSDTCVNLQKPAISFLGVEHFCSLPGHVRYKAPKSAK